jgi:hypothetical protein
MRNYINITTPFVKNSLLVIGIFVVVQCVFAVTGKRMSSDSGDDKAKSSDKTVAFSNIKSSVNFSLKDHYSFNAKKNDNNLNFSSQSIKDQANAMFSFKKGNITYVVPYKTQPGVKLPGFIKGSPSQSVPR